MSDNARRSRTGAITIRDVARAAGVSPMTVSRIINNVPGASAETRAQVLRTVEQLGYRPNVDARRLARAHGKYIGFLIPDRTSLFQNKLLLEALRATRVREAFLFVEDCPVEPGQEQAAAVSRLVIAGADGLIIPSPMAESHFVAEAIERLNIMAVSIGGSSSATPYSVGVDEWQAAYDMTRYLIDLGHRDLGFVLGHMAQQSAIMREDGFRAAAADSIVERISFGQGDFSYASGVEAGYSLLAAHRRPTAIFASNDEMASGVVNAAHRLGLRVPEDLSVAGFDDTAIAEMTMPALTTIHQPIDSIVTAAIDILLPADKAKKPEGHYVHCPHKLIARGSCSTWPRKRA